MPTVPLTPVSSTPSADEKGKFDELVTGPGGVKILVDNKALMHVVGTRMDFVNDRLKWVPASIGSSESPVSLALSTPGPSLCSRTPTARAPAAVVRASPPERRQLIANSSVAVPQPQHNARSLSLLLHSGGNSLL